MIAVINPSVYRPRSAQCTIHATGMLPFLWASYNVFPHCLNTPFPRVPCWNSSRLTSPRSWGTSTGPAYRWAHRRRLRSTALSIAAPVKKYRSVKTITCDVIVAMIIFYIFAIITRQRAWTPEQRFIVLILIWMYR
jgi:hypothetical protein